MYDDASSYLTNYIHYIIIHLIKLPYGLICENYHFLLSENRALCKH